MQRSNYLRVLSLVDVGLNETGFKELCELIGNQKTLTSLDLSWNSMIPAQAKGLLTVLSQNRKLKNLNLSWNNISDVHASQQDMIFISHLIGKIIKHSRTMQHINLTSTGLGTYIIREIGVNMRKSRALMSIHLSGNPGLTRQNMKIFTEGLKVRKDENIDRFIRIDKIVKQAMKEENKQTQMMDAIKAKGSRGHDLTINKTKKEPTMSPSDKLILQRFLGHAHEWPGSAQWYHSSVKESFRTHLKGQKRRDFGCSDEENEKPSNVEDWYMETVDSAVAYSPHHHTNCWICEKHAYTIIFWSKGMAYKLDPVLNKEQTELLRYEIDKDFSEEQNRQNFVNGNLKYSQLDDQVPYLAGSFTGWRYLKMYNLE